MNAEMKQSVEGTEDESRTSLKFSEEEEESENVGEKMGNMYHDYKEFQKNKQNQTQRRKSRGGRYYQREYKEFSGPKQLAYLVPSSRNEKGPSPRSCVMKTKISEDRAYREDSRSFQRGGKNPNKPKGHPQSRGIKPH